MHHPVREGLESMLAGQPDPSLLRHLEECAECRETVQQIQTASNLIHALKPPPDLEPSAGFYARVMDRIEAQRPISIWSVFLEPFFATRLVAATAVLTVIFSIFLFTSPKDDFSASAMPEEILAEQVHPPAQQVNLEQDRDTVLVQLTTYQE